MKILIPALVILFLLFCGLTQADNNIMIMVDTIRSSTYDIPVGFENEDTIQGLSNGYRISASGGMVTWFINGAGYVDSVSRDGLLPITTAWAFRYCGTDTLFPDTVLVGGMFKSDFYGNIPDIGGTVYAYPNNSDYYDQNCDESNSSGDQYG